MLTDDEDEEEGQQKKEEALQGEKRANDTEGDFASTDASDVAGPSSSASAAPAPTTKKRRQSGWVTVGFVW